MLRRDAVDRAFRRYCQSGDPQALGEVFDRTAAELLRVALWLSGNRADAEDLLQRTFLSAIEGRARFDPAQRVLPWLCGIAVNHARSLQRERQRRAREVGEPARPEPDPVAAAAERELAERLRLLRAELVPAYREVLELHLEQGLNAKEIAARLGRPAGTVRTPLVRALDLLRRRLPSGFVAGLVPMVPDVATLVKVKAAVLAAGQQAMPWTAAAAMAIGGGALMGKKLLVVVPLAAALLGVAVFLALPDGPSARATVADPPTPIVVAADAVREPAAPAATLPEA